MTEEEAPKITSAIKTPREKNPGRVAAGKRLGAISKEAKERKKLERENAITEPYETTTTQNTAILVGGLVVIGGALYYLKYHNTEGTEGTAGTERSDTRSDTTEEPPPKFQAYSMDD